MIVLLAPCIATQAAVVPQKEEAPAGEKVPSLDEAPVVIAAEQQVPSPAEAVDAQVGVLAVLALLVMAVTTAESLSWR